MIKRLFPFVLVLLSFGCAKQYPAYWQYNHEIPMYRVGNEFVGEAAGMRKVIARVAPQYDYVQTDENGLNFFQNKDKDEFVMVMNRFGIFKDKLSYANVVAHSGFTDMTFVEKGDLGTNDEYAISVATRNGYNMITYFHYHHDLIGGGWANAGVGYVEQLPQGDSVSWANAKFLEAFKQRARKAVVVLPKD